MKCEVLQIVSQGQQKSGCLPFVNTPLGFHVFYICHQHYYWSEVLPPYQWLLWAGQSLKHCLISKVELVGYDFSAIWSENSMDFNHGLKDWIGMDFMDQVWKWVLFNCIFWSEIPSEFGEPLGGGGWDVLVSERCEWGHIFIPKKSSNKHKLDPEHVQWLRT